MTPRGLQDMFLNDSKFVWKKLVQIFLSIGTHDKYLVANGLSDCLQLLLLTSNEFKRIN